MATGYTKPSSLAKLAGSIAGAGVRRPASKTDAAGPVVSDEEGFHVVLTLERRRAERSRKPFVLMLLDAHQENGMALSILQRALGVVALSTRETDLIGWYRDGEVLGVIFTEVAGDGQRVAAETLRTKIRTSLQERLGRETAKKITITLHVFPEHWDRNDAGWKADAKLYPELRSQVPQKKLSLGIKRAIDIACSATVLLLLSPVLVVVAIAIKLTSKGPVLFKQERLGQFGARFKCLKFRSMYLNNAPTIHQEYVRQFIAGQTNPEETESKAPVVYKITNDPRVTPVGRLLRKMSLDELPQLFNVLAGQMSLVGPRPPVPYEFEIYQPWHRRRVLEVKPGITGLWQVSGRSSTRFDEMVRLDLRYSQSWSLWLDLKILLATPRAVVLGSGAY
jgi:lipopolysaccharide/colanic/teichoic acid biosynthesis glycosyltransferase